MLSIRNRRPLRSYLVIPAIRQEEFVRHLVDRVPEADRPDAVIFDLEDSIPEHRKAEARRDLDAALPEWQERLGRTSELSIKINSRPTAHYDADLAMAERHVGRGVGLCLAKTETLQDLDDCLSLTGTPPGVPILPAFETVYGFESRNQLLAHARPRGIDRFAFGAGDMSSEFGVARDYSLDLLRYILMALVISCRRYGLGLVDSPSRALPRTVGDPPWNVAVRDESRWARANGVVGKIAIHPAQVPIVNQVFGSEDRVAWAERVLEDFAQTPEKRSVVSSLDGQYMGTPTLKWAKQIVDRSED